MGNGNERRTISLIKHQVIKVKSRSCHDVAHLPPPPPPPPPPHLLSLPSMNFLHLMVSEKQPRQTFSRRPNARPSAHPDIMSENNTCTALKGCGVKRLNSNKL